MLTRLGSDVTPIRKAPYLLRGAYQSYPCQRTSINPKVTHYLPTISPKEERPRQPLVDACVNWPLLAGRLRTFPLFHVAMDYLFHVEYGRTNSHCGSNSRVANFLNILKNVDLQYNQFIWDKKIIWQLFSIYFKKLIVSTTYCNFSMLI